MTECVPMPARRPSPKKSYPVCSFERALSVIKSGCGSVRIYGRHGKGENKVFILPEAFRELSVMISYGRRSPMNKNEQKFVGLGHWLKDERGHMITVVSHFIEIMTTNRTAVGASNLGPNGEYNPGLDFLEYHREEFLRYEAEYNTDAHGCTVDPFLKLCGPSEYVLEGHTHPDLGVFYSRTDMVSGGARAAKSPVCIFVCDPVRREMLGSTGRDFAPTEVIVFSRDLPPIEKPEIRPQADTSLNEIIRLASECLRSRSCNGKIRIRPHLGGECLTVKLRK